MMDKTGKIRLLMLSSSFHPAIGGAERQGLALAFSMRARHFSVAVLTLHDRRRRQKCGFLPIPLVGIDFPKVRVIGPIIAYCKGITALFRLSRKRSVVAQVQALDQFTLALGLAALVLKIPLLVRISGAYEMNLGFLTPKWGVRPLLAKVLLRRVNHVLALNPEIEQRLLDLGVQKKAILRLPNAVPDSYFEIARTPPLQRLRLTSPSVLLVGRLAQFKGCEHMLQAWKIVLANHPAALLHFVGDGPLRGELDAMAGRIGIADRVKFWGCIHDVSQFYAEADAFILPSQEEGMSNSLLEAMAAGLPCVVSDLPSTRWIIDNEYTGLLVPPSDEAKLASAINRLLSNPDERAVLGQVARERVAPWAFSRLTENYTHLYDQMRWDAEDKLKLQGRK